MIFSEMAMEYPSISEEILNESLLVHKTSKMKKKMQQRELCAFNLSPS